MGVESLQREQIAIAPEPAYLPHAPSRHKGAPTKWLTPFRVRKVHFHDRKDGRPHRVKESDRRVGQSPRIEKNASEPLFFRAANPVEKTPLMVCLPPFNDPTERARALVQAHVNFGKGLDAVHAGFPLSK